MSAAYLRVLIKLVNAIPILYSAAKNKTKEKLKQVSIDKLLKGHDSKSDQALQAALDKCVENINDETLGAGNDYKVLEIIYRSAEEKIRELFIANKPFFCKNTIEGYVDYLNNHLNSCHYPRLLGLVLLELYDFRSCSDELTSVVKMLNPGFKNFHEQLKRLLPTEDYIMHDEYSKNFKFVIQRHKHLLKLYKHNMLRYFSSMQVNL